jgi:hypothetical protein
MAYEALRHYDEHAMTWPHRSWPRRGRQKSTRVAEHGSAGRGVRRLCRRSHGVLGPLVDWLARKTTREAAVAEIARRYREFLGIFENNLYFVKAGG